MISHHAVLCTSENPLSYVPCDDDGVLPGREYRLPQFGIDDVRALTAEAYRRPMDGAEQQRILVTTEFITEEAQQALLKLIEEPPLSTKFMFVIPEGYGLLPTLESRFERMVSARAGGITEAFLSFCEASYAERMALIERSTKAKDHAWQQQIKNGLASYILTKREGLSIEILRELEYVSRLLLTRGASNKFLLEHLALTLPLS